MPRILPLLCVPLLLATTTIVRSQDLGDPAAGRRIVEGSCLDCHGSASGPAHAPSFPAIAAMPSTTAMSIGVFLRSSHPTMPNVMLAPRDLDDVIGYILSLR